MPLNPEIAAYLQLVEAGSGRRLPMHLMTPTEARVAFDASAVQFTLEGPELVRVETLWVEARDGNRLEARLYSARPRDDGPLPAVLYLHGGGYVVGSLASHDSLCRSLAESGGFAVVALAYRRAPEAKFPTASQDTSDAWHWLLANAEALGLDGSRMAVAGDSVGASLATVLARELALAEAAVQPRLQVLLYPVTNALAATPSLQRYASGHLLEVATLQWFYQHYQRTPSDREAPQFSPLRADVPSTMAPALVVLAECDPLHDEGLAYVAHLREAGVGTVLKDWPGMTHDFMRMGMILEEASEALEEVVEALHAVL